MQIDKKLVSRLEHLARLELSEEERQLITQDLNDILAMVEQLNDLDSSNIEPLVYLNPDQNVWREDKVRDQIDREEAMKNAPDSDGQYFKVPKVIDL